MIYRNREEAGQKLAKALRRFEGEDVVVLALPRGGVALGAEVARALRAPLDVVFVRKIGHPDYPEYAIGAIVEGHEAVLNPREARFINKQWLDREIKAARQLLEHRKTLYYGPSYQPHPIKGKTVILIDDGIATGYTMAAAVDAVSDGKPKRIIIAAPVASADSLDSIEPLADEIVVLDNPKNFMGAIGPHYSDFKQVDDEEVKTLLKEVDYDLHRTIPEDKHFATVSQRDQEFPDKWTRYRPVR